MMRTLLALSILFGLPGVTAEDVKKAPKVKPNAPDEPKAEKLSLLKAASFLDDVALGWTREKSCGTCHTNYPYLMARPCLKTPPSEAFAEIRKFFEQRAANWGRGQKDDKPRWDTEVVATAVTLAISDAQTTGQLHPSTRKALDKMWTLQKPHGAWDWLKCDWPPMEHDDYFGAVYAALGVGFAPGDYARTDAARAGLDRMRGYFAKTQAPDLHHKTWLLWASLKIDGLMSAGERDSAIKDLLSLQHADGGWSLPSLGAWKRRSGEPNDKNAPSDGYATGLVIYVLRQTGMPATAEPIQKGVEWLKANQRESGRWFTRSLNNDRAHYIAHAGTSFAVLALVACGVEAN